MLSEHAAFASSRDTFGWPKLTSDAMSSSSKPLDIPQTPQHQKAHARKHGRLEPRRLTRYVRNMSLFGHREGHHVPMQPLHI